MMTDTVISMADRFERPQRVDAIDARLAPLKVAVLKPLFGKEGRVLLVGLLVASFVVFAATLFTGL